ncbi:LexA family protein [Spirosoma aerolatum]|uniref:LexA family protein n=1 Tax=Spirosoma aerolatum TaxID=1211326 RepID=UPI0009AD4BAF|nr:translesion error-prone DNA polymerase V autoproteolytic subunit [Spirosoma aerolatum]
MTKPSDSIEPIPAENIYRVDPSRRQAIPYYSSPVQAGFTSPAESYIEARLNLQDLCVKHPDMTHFVKASGESMTGAYIFPGSILIVDAMIEVRTGKIIVASVNGEWCVKRYVEKGEMIMLEPSNAKYLPIYVHPKQDHFEILGVVTFIVSEPPKYVRPR